MKNILSVLLMVSLLLTIFGCNKENPAKVQDQEEVLQEVIENIPVTLRICGEGTLRFKDGSLLDVKGDTSFVLPQKGRIEKMILQNSLKKIKGECDVAIVTYNIILMDDPFGFSGTGSFFFTASNVGVIGCEGQWKHRPKSCISTASSSGDSWIQNSHFADSGYFFYSPDDIRSFSTSYSGCYLGGLSNCVVWSFSSDRDIDQVGVAVDFYGQSRTINSIWIIVKGAIQVSWSDCPGDQT